MPDNVYKLFLHTLALTYNLILVAGTTWLVATENWSMWTYLLCICLMVSSRKAIEVEKVK